jgi:enediyne biosynthesis protein E5
MTAGRTVMNAARWRFQDPRLYQILILATLMAYGVVHLDLEIGLPRALLLLATVLLTQYACSRLWRLPAFDPRSALISGLSLCLLLRTNSAALAVAAAVVTIASKFVLRVRGKHVFNPTNFGIVAMMLATGQVWVSPGQWGSAAFFAFLLACLGGLVVNRAARSDVTYAFLAFYLAVLFGRALWLGQPAAIPLHQLESGAFLIFTFFMISDPKTTPDSRAGRILFALLVALGAGFVHFVLYRPNGLLLSLAFLSPVVPLIDLLLPGKRYVWRRLQAAAAPISELPLLEERRIA